MPAALYDTPPGVARIPRAKKTSAWRNSREGLRAWRVASELSVPCVAIDVVEGNRLRCNERPAFQGRALGARGDRAGLRFCSTSPPVPERKRGAGGGERSDGQVQGDERQGGQGRQQGVVEPEVEQGREVGRRLGVVPEALEGPLIRNRGRHDSGSSPTSC